MHKSMKYGIVLTLIGLIAYNSVYFRKLSEMKQSSNVAFNVSAYVDEIWKGKLDEKLKQAIDLIVLISEIKTYGDSAIIKYSQSLSIGNYRYALVKTDVMVLELREDDLKVQTQHADSLLTFKLATEFIYGNAIRDATGMVQVKDFPNTSDLNAISESMNERVKKEYILPFRNKVKIGDRIEVVGAIALNKEHVNWQGLEIIPIRIKSLN